MAPDLANWASNPSLVQHGSLTSMALAKNHQELGSLVERCGPTQTSNLLKNSPKNLIPCFLPPKEHSW